MCTLQLRKLFTALKEEDQEPEALPLAELGSQAHIPTRRIQKLSHSGNEAFLSSLPRFGPSYPGEEPIFSQMKEQAWNIVLSGLPETEESKTMENFMAAIGNVAKEATGIYADGILPNNDGRIRSEFKMMMIKDGCFFIHLAFLFLGGQEHLGYSSDDGVFGNGGSSDNVKPLKEGMLLVGNQIPAVILRELMEQEYFQGVTKRAKFKPPRGLFRRALYELLFSPVPRMDNGSSSLELPIDLLHSLQCLVLGHPASKHLSESSSSSDDRGEVKLNIEDIDGRKRFLSATEMKHAGIGFKAHSNGSTRIRFTSHIFCGPYLHLPVLTVDQDLELVFESLIEYETCHEPSSKHGRQVCSYLRLMKDMVPAWEDATILADSGILDCNGLQHREMLPEILNRLKCDEHITADLYTVRLLTSSYSRPIGWDRFKELLSFVLVLTLLQTIYTALSYHQNKNEDTSSMTNN